MIFHNNRSDPDGRQIQHSQFLTFVLTFLVAVVPGIGFGVEGFLRLSYATSEENIIEGFSRIKKFVEQFS